MFLISAVCMSDPWTKLVSPSPKAASHDFGSALLWQASIKLMLMMQECQEKEGLFMMAFHSPVSALEWALTLQLALTK